MKVDSPPLPHTQEVGTIVDGDIIGGRAIDGNTVDGYQGVREAPAGGNS